MRSTSQSSIRFECKAFPKETYIQWAGEADSDVREISGYRGQRRPNAVNPCVHTISSWRPVCIPTVLDQGSAAWMKWTASCYDAGKRFTIDSVVPSIDPSTYDAIMQDLVGEIPTDVLLPNFITELPQALMLHKQLMRAFSRKPKTWNDAGLAYTFGLAPLAKDIVSLARLGQRVRNRIAYLSRVSDGDFTPWKRKISVDTSGFQPGFSSGWPSLELLGCLRNGRFVDPTVTAEASLFARRCRTRTISPEAEQSAGMLDAAGITKAGSAIWEAIPFSFVADWFYPFGRALNVLNTSAFQGCMSYTMSGWQSRILCTSQYVAKPNCGYAYSSAEVLIGAGQVSIYRRGPGFPNTTPSSNFGVRQSLLSGMLAMQRL